MPEELKEKDSSAHPVFESVLAEPRRLEAMSDSELQALMQDAWSRVERVRMGGRSLALCALSVMLWHTHQRWSKAEVDVERRVADAFRISLDPSFMTAEWAVVVGGALVARYARYLGDDRDEILRDYRHDVEFLCRNGVTQPPVRAAASALLGCWDEAFRSGLNSVVRASMGAWPDCGELRKLPDDAHAAAIDVAARFPGSLGMLTEADRRLYRSFLERSGVWHHLERLDLA